MKSICEWRRTNTPVRLHNNIKIRIYKVNYFSSICSLIFLMSSETFFRGFFFEGAVTKIAKRISKIRIKKGVISKRIIWEVMDLMNKGHI